MVDETVQVNVFPNESESTRDFTMAELAAALAGDSGSLLVQALAAGLKIAHGVDSVTGTKDIDTGLATVTAVIVSASSDLDGTSLLGVSGVITGAAGHFTAKCWKATAAGNVALIAATAAFNVSWIAVGT